MSTASAPRSLQLRFDELGAQRPDLPLLGPYLLYLGLMALRNLAPPALLPYAIALNGIVPLCLVWMFRRSLPPWGKPYFWIAIPAGVFCGWGWMMGQYFFDGIGVPTWLPGMPGGGGPAVDPRFELGAGSLFWTTYGLRCLVAITAVPVVEELFWRAFLLRAFIDYQNFERIPLGTFTWFSFLGTSLLSTIQHPGNWAISILCWFAFNALFYWTRSILCLVIVHGVTNLALYVLVLRIRDWTFV